MLRNIVATIVGVLVAGLVVGLVESINMFLFPPPPGIDLHDPKQVAAMVSTLPMQAFVIVLFAWSLGCFCGGWIATRLAPSRPATPAVIVAAFILAGVVYNVVALPHPLWMSIAGLLLPLPSTLLGARLAGWRRA